MSQNRLSRKAKIRRVKKRRSKLRVRSSACLAAILHSGAGTHSGLDTKEEKAPKEEDWDEE